MTGKTHSAAGFAAGAALAAAASAPPAETGVIIALSVFGSLLPDIDHAHSTITHQTAVVGAVVSRLFKHRTWLHDPVIYALLFAAWAALSPGTVQMAVPIFSGIATHLLLDMLNPTGIPVCWAFNKKRVHLAKIHTGSGLDSMVCIVMAVAGVLALAAGFGLDNIFAGGI